MALMYYKKSSLILGSYLFGANKLGNFFYSTASVIIFHGAGDTGSGIREWIQGLLGRDLKGSHIRYVYPTAPMQKYTKFDGEMSTVWFDRHAADKADDEEYKGMSRSYDIANALIEEQIEQGIAENRIIVGGFSQGGALAMHTGYHLNLNLAGVFAHSSTLDPQSIVYDTLRNNSNAVPPELCMFHGTDDDVVEYEWGRETFEMLHKLGVSGTFTTLNNTAHELLQSSMLHVESFILKKLP